MDKRLNSAASRDIAYHLHPYTNARKHETEGPLVISKGKGIYVYDDQGKEYIEGLAGLWCTALGFGEQRLVKAAERQMSALPYYHAFAHKTADISIDLAEKLIGLAPVPMSKVFFANSGSEANDTMIKMIWYYNNALGRPEKKKIISRFRGYHGVTIAAASLTHMAYVQEGFDLPASGRFVQTGCPHHYRHAAGGRERIRLHDPAGRRARSSDPGGRPGNDCRLRRRTGPRRRRCRGAAGRLLAEDPGGPEEARHPAGRRRGDLRLRPDRQHVGFPDLRHRARHHDHGQGAQLRLSAHLGRHDQRQGLSGRIADGSAERWEPSATATPTAPIRSPPPSPSKPSRSTRKRISSDM